MSQNIEELFNDDNKNQMGLTDESSTIIINNFNKSQLPLCQGSPFTEDEEETDDFRLFYFVIDASGSMNSVEDEVRDGFNNILIPGLMGGVLDLVGSIRIAGLSFNNTVSKLWNGVFTPIQDLPKLGKEYDTGGSTALYDAILDGITDLTGYASKIYDRTGTMPESEFVVISDGAENSSKNRDLERVSKIISSLSIELFTTVFIGFETGESVDFTSIAKDLGFREIMDLKLKPGENDEDIKKRFRKAVNVLSEASIKRGSQTNVGKTSLDSQGSTGFFTNI